MISFEDKLTRLLFETDAVRVCKENEPFWYTSGAIGPYYVNTHFLYGNEAKAKDLLSFIDSFKENIFELPIKVLDKIKENYYTDLVYKDLIDSFITFIMENVDLSSIDYISGGERRDWFFSPLIAEMLNKPHLTIYKNLSVVATINGKVTGIDNLENKKVLHIADLINEASSYERAWIPAISKLKGKIVKSFVVVDRKQGGEELLNKLDVESYSMVNIDIKLFLNALSQKFISKSQYDMIEAYISNPKEAMRDFLKNNPEFLEKALNSDEKTKERARLLIEKKIYF